MRRSCFNTRQKSDSLRKSELKDINQVLFSCMAGNFAKTYLSMPSSGLDTDIPYSYHDIFYFISEHFHTTYCVM